MSPAKGTKRGYASEQEMDDLSNWRRYLDGPYRKRIGGVWWCVRKSNKVWSLEINEVQVTTRSTMGECQRLAHKTARFWAGDTE